MVQSVTLMTASKSQQHSGGAMYHHTHLTTMTTERTSRYRSQAERHRLVKNLRRRRDETARR
jgi:hypothetical protein